MRKTILILLFTILSTLTLSAQTRQEVLANKMAEHDSLYELASENLSIYENKYKNAVQKLKDIESEFGKQPKKDEDKSITRKRNNLKLDVIGYRNGVSHYQSGLDELKSIKKSINQLENIKNDSVFNEKLKKVESDLNIADLIIRRTILGW